VVAYGLSPLFLLRLTEVHPAVNPWLAWAIGITLTIRVLYSGIPKIMEPDPPHAFGLFLMSSIFLLFITGLIRFITDWYLQAGLSAFNPSWTASPTSCRSDACGLNTCRVSPAGLIMRDEIHSRRFSSPHPHCPAPLPPVCGGTAHP